MNKLFQLSTEPAKEDCATRSPPPPIRREPSVDEQITAFNGSSVLGMGSCYVPSIGGSCSYAVAQDNEYSSTQAKSSWWQDKAMQAEQDFRNGELVQQGEQSSSQARSSWWPPAMREEPDSALEELQAIALALEDSCSQAPERCATQDSPDQEIPKMKLLF